MKVSDIYDNFSKSGNDVLGWLTSELAKLRTGRVTPDVLSGISVEHYGSRNQLSALATIGNSDARTLTISVWDEGAIVPIEKAIADANVGANPIVDGKIIRLTFPTQTEEAREQTIKTLHKKAEETRIKLRQARDEAVQAIKKMKEGNDLTEDDWFDGKKELDKRIDEFNKKIENLVDAKEEEIRKV